MVLVQTQGNFNMNQGSWIPGSTKFTMCCDQSPIIMEQEEDDNISVAWVYTEGH